MLFSRGLLLFFPPGSWAAVDHVPSVVPSMQLQDVGAASQHLLAAFHPSSSAFLPPLPLISRRRRAQMAKNAFLSPSTNRKIQSSPAALSSSSSSRSSTLGMLVTACREMSTATSDLEDPEDETRRSQSNVKGSPQHELQHGSRWTTSGLAQTLLPLGSLCLAGGRRQRCLLRRIFRRSMGDGTGPASPLCDYKKSLLVPSKTEHNTQHVVAGREDGGGEDRNAAEDDEANNSPQPKAEESTSLIRSKSPQESTPKTPDAEVVQYQKSEEERLSRRLWNVLGRAFEEDDQRRKAPRRAATASTTTLRGGNHQHAEMKLHPDISGFPHDNVDASPDVHPASHHAHFSTAGGGSLLSREACRGALSAFHQANPETAATEYSKWVAKQMAALKRRMSTENSRKNDVDY
ncbi:unnamed protein product [Amoebophrya sp. A25]|nr:unnamed protein product [Amoebophrya sp. A25]|eukprot:GSA25T00004699001.1